MRSQPAALALSVAAALALLALASRPSAAQVVIGNGGGPEVQVNLGVLDRLPPSGPVPGHKVTHLKRPGTAAKSAHARAPAKHRTASEPKAAPRKQAATLHPPAAEPVKPAKTKPAPPPKAVAAAKPSATPAAPEPKAEAAGDAMPRAKIETAALPATAPDATTPTDAKMSVAANVSADTTPSLPAAEPPPSKPAAVDPAPAAAPPPEPAAVAKPAAEAPPPAAAPAPVAKPRPAAAESGIVAGGLLGGGVGEPSSAPGVVNVPTRPTPSVPRERQQVAALSPATAASSVAQGPNGLRISFTGSSAALSPAVEAELSGLAQMLAGNNDRIMLSGYASGTAASGARRVALSRVLAVRAYLVEKGVQQPRIDVRAVGAPTDGGSPERVDIAKIGR